MFCNTGWYPLSYYDYLHFTVKCNLPTFLRACIAILATTVCIVLMA